LIDPRGQRSVARVDGSRLHLLDAQSVYSLAESACQSGSRLSALIGNTPSSSSIDYDQAYHRRSEWRLLPAFDYPNEPARCLVSGTGLTHRASAENRIAMNAESAAVTDSARMYQLGVEGGRPAPGTIGVSPEWFYKGCGTVLRAHGEPLHAPNFGGDGGEEPEIAGAYIIDRDGRPRRVGFMQANEFSDHVTEKRNYLYLAPSKLRECAIGPELVLDQEFNLIPGVVSIERAGGVLWSKQIATGEEKMCHSLANIEHHHFKYPAHRRPGDAHVHFYGADAFSFGAGITLEDGDLMRVSFEGFGRPLQNPILIDKTEPRPVEIRSL